MKLNHDARQMILGALRSGADMRMAARAVGVTRQAIGKLMRRSPAFKEEVDEARSFADERIVKTLYDIAMSGNVTAMIFWLKNRKRHEWRDRHEIEHEHTIKSDIVGALREGRRRAGKETAT